MATILSGQPVQYAGLSGRFGASPAGIKLAATVGMDERITLARASYEAFVRKDRAAIEKLLAEDFHFSSPLDNRLDRNAYFERCWPNSDRISAFEFVHLVQDDDRVFVTYVGRSSDGNRFRNTEILTFRGHQIVEVEVYFGWSIPHPAAPGGYIDP